MAVDILATVQEWVAKNQLLTVLVLVPAVTGVLNATVTRKRTPEEYARMSPRRAAFYRFIQAAGWDTAKVTETLTLLITGRTPIPTSVVKEVNVVEKVDVEKTVEPAKPPADTDKGSV